jgi:leucyl-tRNA synthetase
MELLNAVARHPQTGAQDRSIVQEALEIAVMSLSPIIPHAAHALWRELGHRTAMIDETWLQPDEQALQSSTVQMVVQVNGKLRAHITVAVDADEAAIRSTALADANVQKFIGTEAIRKLIVVRGKLLNIVV